MPLKDDLELAAQLQSALATCEDRTLRERLTHKMRVHREEADSAFQKELRTQFPNKAIIVMNLTNGSCGYLPPDELYDLDIYQVWQAPYARGIRRFCWRK